MTSTEKAATTQTPIGREEDAAATMAHVRGRHAMSRARGPACTTGTARAGDDQPDRHHLRGGDHDERRRHDGDPEADGPLHEGTREEGHPESRRTEGIHHHEPDQLHDPNDADDHDDGPQATGGSRRLTRATDHPPEQVPTGDEQDNHQSITRAQSGRRRAPPQRG